jgi:hypothetical protein
LYLIRNHSAIWIKVKDFNYLSKILYFYFLEMEENAKEVEHDLRENIDLLQNQLREV